MVILMYEEVESKLIENEQIEMALETDIRKTKKYWEKYVYSLILLIVLWGLYIYTFCVTHTIAGIKYDGSGFGFDKYVAFLGIFAVSMFALFFFLYDLIVNTKNRFNKYWITNIRVIAFNNKKGYTIRNIERIDKIGTYNIKNNYADIILIFKKVTSTDKAVGPLVLTGIKNYTDAVYQIREKNMNIEVFNDENLIPKKKKTVPKGELEGQVIEANPNTIQGTTVDTTGVQMDANKPNRHLGTVPDLNKIPMGEEEAQAQKAAVFKNIR